MKDHLLGQSGSDFDSLSCILLNDAYRIKFSKLINIDPEPDPAIAAFERDDHLPDGTVKPPSSWLGYADAQIKAAIIDAMRAINQTPVPMPVPMPENPWHNSPYACRCDSCQESRHNAFGRLMGQGNLLGHQ